MKRPTLSELQAEIGRMKIDHAETLTALQRELDAARSALNAETRRCKQAEEQRDLAYDESLRRDRRIAELEGMIVAWREVGLLPPKGSIGAFEETPPWKPDYGATPSRVFGAWKSGR